MGNKSIQYFPRINDYFGNYNVSNRNLDEHKKVIKDTLCFEEPNNILLKNPVGLFFHYLYNMFSGNWKEYLENEKELVNYLHQVINPLYDNYTQNRRRSFVDQIIDHELEEYLLKNKDRISWLIQNQKFFNNAHDQNINKRTIQNGLDGMGTDRTMFSLGAEKRKEIGFILVDLAIIFQGLGHK